MKNLRSSLVVYGFLGLVAVSLALYRLVLTDSFIQNPLFSLRVAPEKLVSVKGKLILKVFPGPPDYYSVDSGDRSDYCWVLKLDGPSSIKGVNAPVVGPTNTLGSITKWSHPDEVMLVLDERLEQLCQRYQNEEITIIGQLFHAHTVHHYTPTLMDVRELKTLETKT